MFFFQEMIEIPMLEFISTIFEAYRKNLLTITIYLLKTNNLLVSKMGVNETLLDEIYNERIQYLINIDEMMYEMYEPVFDKRAGISKETPFYSSNIDMVNKISVVDSIFTSKEYQTFIKLTRPEDISKRKFQPGLHKKLRSEELQDFDTIIED